MLVNACVHDHHVLPLVYNFFFLADFFVLFLPFFYTPTMYVIHSYIVSCIFHLWIWVDAEDVLYILRGECECACVCVCVCILFAFGVSGYGILLYGNSNPQNGAHTYYLPSPRPRCALLLFYFRRYTASFVFFFFF